MHEKNQEPEILLSLELHPKLSHILETKGHLKISLGAALLHGLTELLSTLGIPGTPVIDIVPLQEEAMTSDRLLRVSVHEHVCRFPNELLRRVHSYVNGALIAPQASPALILAWLCELTNEATEIESRSSKFIDFISLACLEVLKRQPDKLLEIAQVDFYSSSLPRPISESKLQQEIWPPDSAWLLSIFKKVVQLKISLADTQKVAKVLGTREHQQDDVAEDLIEELRPGVLEIRLPQDYLKEISLVHSKEEYNQFLGLRNSLFLAFGQRYPAFRFVTDESLQPHCFSFKINHVSTLPWVGLESHHYLVYLPFTTLDDRHIDYTRVFHPNWDTEAPLIDADTVGSEAFAELPICDQAHYVNECLYTTLWENGQCFLYRKETRSQIAHLALTNPSLVKTVQSKFSDDQVTRVLRALVSENISVKYLRLILEQMLDYDVTIIDPSYPMDFEYLVTPLQASGNATPYDTVNLTSYIRAGMKQAISVTSSRGQGRLNFYSVSAEIIKMVARQDLSESDKEVIVKAVRTAITQQESATPASILTFMHVRPLLRAIIADEFPQLQVLAFQELNSDVVLNQIGEITLVYPQINAEGH